MPSSGLPCIYCTKPADSEEHIFGTWLIDDIKAETGLAPASATRQGDGGPSTVLGGFNKKGKPTLELTTDLVCASCNNGWMNEVDRKARRYMRTLIGGHRLTLNPKIRRELSAWTAKTAVTLRVTHGRPDPINASWSHRIYTTRHHTPLPDWRIWIARFAGTQPRLTYWGEDVSVVADSKTVYPNGILATIVIFGFVVQLLGFDGPAEPHVSEIDRAIQIWPTGPNTEWPPPVALDDTSIQEFADRFKTPNQP